MYHYTDGGLRNVWLKNGYVEKQTPYGKAVAFQDIEGLTKAICLALVRRPGKLTGAEFRYVRCNMLLSQKALGNMMGYTEQAIAKWEKTGKIPKAVEFFLRLVYLGKNDGNKRISTMIEAANIIDKVSNSKIIISESRRKWVSKIEQVEDEDQSVDAMA
jgi:putative transcriptional regulator